MKQLTIAHIDTQMTWRGGERQALELMKGLRERGQNNTLFCRPDSEISIRAQDSGFAVEHVPLRGEWDVMSSLNMRRAIKHGGFDIVHTHTSHAHMLGLMAVAGNPSCKLVVSRRVDFHVTNPLSRTIKYGPFVDKIIAVSDAVRRILIEDGIPSGRVVTIRSGFIVNEFSESDIGDTVRKSLGISDETPVVITVAALAPHKSIHDLLKAAKIVAEKRPDVKFIIAGEGEERESLEKNIANLGLEKTVILMGFVNDVASVYRSGTVFAMSSREEGLCTSLLDAMYFGLPIVATSAGGIPELVQDEVNGLIVPVGDYMEFAEKLLYLIDHPERRSKMGERSRELIDQNRIDQTIDKTLEVYRSLVVS